VKLPNAMHLLPLIWHSTQFPNCTLALTLDESASEQGSTLSPANDGVKVSSRASGSCCCGDRYSAVEYAARLHSVALICQQEVLQLERFRQAMTELPVTTPSNLPRYVKEYMMIDFRRSEELSTRRWLNSRMFKYGD
jgi:hypothetical protein